MSKPAKNRYDTESLWVVFEERPQGGPVVYSFDGHAAAASFVLEGLSSRAGPFKLSRLPLERAAPILVAAANAVLLALTAYRSNPLHKDELLSAAEFLLAALNYARLEPDVADIYRATRRDLLQAYKEEGYEPQATLIEELRQHLLKYKSTGCGPLQ
jgi:hypothetical protein